MSRQYAVPDRLIAVVKAEATVTQDYTGKRFKCRPAFVTDYYRPGLLNTARKWGNKTWGKTPVSPPEEVEIPNDPLTKLIVLNIEHRREGGVALKVITEQGWLVDLREEEFMEAALTGALVGGVITGEFVWSRGVNQMRLVRVGSKLHQDRAAFGNGV